MVLDGDDRDVLKFRHGVAAAAFATAGVAEADSGGITHGWRFYRGGGPRVMR